MKSFREALLRLSDTIAPSTPNHQSITVCPPPQDKSEENRILPIIDEKNASNDLLESLRDASKHTRGGKPSRRFKREPKKKYYQHDYLWTRSYDTEVRVEQNIKRNNNKTKLHCRRLALDGF
jgi:hypothetical protein